MAPAQALAGTNEETKPAVKLEEPEMANGDFVCANNCEDNAFYGEPSGDPRKAIDATEDEEVDVLECNSGDALESMKDEDLDATEHSSSFGDTLSESGNPSDDEVHSGFAVENGDSLLLDGSSRVFKKKRVTDHWRKFICAIMWRCQWLELRMKELHSQAVVYDKELEAYKYEKQLQSKAVKLANSASRSVPLAYRSRKKKAMRRQKRKRNEDTIDTSLYMSNHTIFSYYENKRHETDCQSVDDDCDDQVENVDDDLEWSVLRFRRRDSSLEQILLDIESAVSRVLQLRSRLNEVACINAMEMSSTPDNLFPGGLPTSCAQSPSSSPSNDGDAMQFGSLNTPTHHLSEYEIEDMVMPGSAVSSYGDAAELDMLESTMGLFSATDIPLDQHETAELYKEEEEEDVLINNQAAEEGLQDFEKFGHAIEKPQEMVKEEAGSSEEASAKPELSIPEPHTGSERDDMPQPLLLKPCYTGKKRGRKPKKRRRGGSAGGSGGVKNVRAQRRRLA